MSRDDIDRLLVEVRQQARARAAAQLTEELADRLVRDGRRRLGLDGGTQPPAPALSPPPVLADAGALWVYGFVRAGDPVPAEPGVGGGQVGQIAGGDLAVLCSPLDGGFDAEDAEAVAQAAQAHDAVLRAAFSSGTVLPLRFGTVLRGADTARLLTDAGFAAALAAVEGLGEWRVVLHAQTVAGPSRAAEESGTSYLARKATQLRASTPAAVRSVLDERLAAVSVARSGDHVLVDRRKEDEFVSTVDDLRDEVGPLWRIETTGPWPAFHFTDLAARA